MKVKIKQTSASKGLLKRGKDFTVHFIVTLNETEKHILKTSGVGERCLIEYDHPRLKEPEQLQVKDALNGKQHFRVFVDQMYALSFEDELVGELENLAGFLKNIEEGVADDKTIEF